MKTKIGMLMVLALLVSAVARAEGESGADENSSDKSIAERTGDAIEHGMDAADKGVQRGVDAAESGVERGTSAAKRGIKRGAEAAESGIKRGAAAAGRGIKRGVNATGRGLKKAGEWVEKKTDDSDDKKE
jgi:phage protein D